MVDEYKIHFRRRFVVEDGDIGKVEFDFKKAKRVVRRRRKVRSEFERLQQIVVGTGEADPGDQEIVRSGGEVNFRNGDAPEEQEFETDLGDVGVSRFQGLAAKLCEVDV